MAATLTAVGPSTNGAASDIEGALPYRVECTIVGEADLLLHRWNVEAVESKAKAAKGSAAKKTDNIESYLYRDEETQQICLPGEYLRMAIVQAAKYRQDPRSPRKSAMDLVKAGLVCLSPLCSLGKDTYDYEHKCRVQVQRNGVTRVRPAFRAGWTVDCVFMVNLPEYMPQDFLHGLLTNAGKLIGVGDFRPTYGRFRVTKFALLRD
jgi:hypothetical protein